MLAIDFIQRLEKEAKEYRIGASESVIRNDHMNEYPKGKRLEQEEIDALLVDFINRIAYNMGIDYGLYTKDIR